MAVLLSPIGGVAAQFFDNNGDPLSGGKLFTYAAGTTTPLATYTAQTAITPHANPIILDAAGRVPGGEIWLSNGFQYKFLVKTNTDVLLATYDNILGINATYANFTSQQEIQTATPGQTVFTLTTMQYQPGTSSLSVFVDGINQYGPGASYAYVETSSTQITFNTPLAGGESVKFTNSQVNGSSYGDAFQIGYTYPAAGATVSNVGNRLASTIYVSDFGAVGDGVTDDTVAIQAALDAATVADAPVFCDPGKTYLVFALKVGSDFNLNGATLKKRPATALDPTMGAFTGNSTVFWIPAPTGMCAMLYCTANVTIENGTIDGNAAAETYGTAYFGGSFASNTNRAGIVASRSWNNVRSLTVRNIKFNSVYGSSVAAEYLDNCVIDNCVETNGRSLFAFCLSQWTSPFASGGNLRVTNCTLSGPRDLGGNGDPAVFDGQTTFTLENVICDSTTQTTSSVIKIQNMKTASALNNTLKNAAFTLQNNSVLPSGDSLLIHGNTFINTNPTVQAGGIQGGNSIYKLMTFTDNMFLNAYCTMCNSGEKFVIANNTILTTQDCRSGGNNLFYAISSNPSASGANIGSLVVQNNTVDLGGFARHVGFNVPPAGVDKLSIINNRFEGADVVFGGGLTYSVPNVNTFEMRLCGNEFYDNRSLGRINAFSLNACVISGNKCYSWSAAASDPTLVAGYTGKGLYVVLIGPTCNVAEISNNAFYEQNLSANDYPIWLNFGSATVGALWVTDNTIQTPTPTFTILVQPATTNVSRAVVRGNWLATPFLCQWTTANSTVNGNSGPDAINVVQGLARSSHTLRGVAAATAGGSAGYIEVDIQGTIRKIPIYAV